jgi:putative sterol carrier protein
MAEPTQEFFTGLATRHQPLLERTTGVVRFDITDGERTEHWTLEIRKGDVTVSHKGPSADCVLSTDIATFDAILTGKTNAMAAVLRGALDVQGKIILLAALQRLFPGSEATAEQPAAGYARRSS